MYSPVQLRSTTNQAKHDHTVRKKYKTIYQLKSLRPLTLRRVRIFRPFLVRSLARNPWRRFCTRREGLYVRLGAASEALAEKEREGWLCGCANADVIEGRAKCGCCDEMVGRVGMVVGSENAENARDWDWDCERRERDRMGGIVGFACLER